MRYIAVVFAALFVISCAEHDEPDQLSEPNKEHLVATPYEVSCTATEDQRPAPGIDLARAPSGELADAWRHFLILNCPDWDPTKLETSLYLSPLERPPLQEPLDPAKTYTFVLEPRPPGPPDRPVLLEIRDGERVLFRRPKAEEEHGDPVTK